jgi:hypothetical protein
VKDCPKRAVGFDFDGAEFTHVDCKVTFEVLVASFGLEGDPGLVDRKRSPRSSSSLIGSIAERDPCSLWYCRVLTRRPAFQFAYLWPSSWNIRGELVRQPAGVIGGARASYCRMFATRLLDT